LRIEVAVPGIEVTFGRQRIRVILRHSKSIPPIYSAAGGVV
jgi:hypothetical protein